MLNSSDDPAAIERDVEQTRAHLGSTLNELQRRLSPGRMVDEGLSWLRTNQGSEFARNLGEKVRENPLAVALVGVGLTWLMASRQPRRPTSPLNSGICDGTEWSDLIQRARAAGDQLMRNADETDAEFQARVAEARGKVLGLSRRIEESAEAFTDRVQRLVADVRDSVAEGYASIRRTAGAAVDNAKGGLGSVSGRVGKAGHNLSDAASRGYEHARDTVGRSASGLADNPVLLGTVSFAMGALFGALLPSSEVEEEYLGDAARGVRGSAEALVDELREQGQKLVQGEDSDQGPAPLMAKGTHFQGPSQSDVLG